LIQIDELKKEIEKRKQAQLESYSESSEDSHDVKKTEKNNLVS